MARKKQPEESPEDQAKRFDAEVRRLIDAGELSPTKAETGLDRFVRRIKPFNRPKAPS